MHLTEIVGETSVQSMTLMYGFIHQYRIFSALAGINVSGAVAFLNEMATIFAMIGLLVLVFSPSLWKAKYVVSWSFLFLVVLLGASVGPEFGYNFTRAPTLSAMNVPLGFQELPNCSQKEYMNGSCHKLALGDRLAQNMPNYVSAAAVNRPFTYADQFGSLLSNVINNQGNPIITVSSSGGVSKFDTIGFAPQVYILYITNRLKSSLEKAMAEFVNPLEFQQRKRVMDMIANARVQNPQLSGLTQSYKDLCDASPTYIETLANPTSLANIASLKNKSFTVKELLISLESAYALSKKHDEILYPMIFVDESDPNAQYLLSINKSIRDTYFLNGYTPGPMFSMSSFEQSVTDSPARGRALGVDKFLTSLNITNNSLPDYKQLLKSSDKNTQAFLNAKAYLVMPTHNLSGVEKFKLTHEEKKITIQNAGETTIDVKKEAIEQKASIIEGGNVAFSKLGDCQEIAYAHQNLSTLSFDTAVKNFMADGAIKFAQQQQSQANHRSNIVNQSVVNSNVPISLEQYRLAKGEINDPALAAIQAIINYYGNEIDDCRKTGSSTLKCLNNIDDMQYLRQRYNSFALTNDEFYTLTPKSGNDVTVPNHLTTSGGIDNLAFNLGKNFTEAFAGPLSWFQGIKKSLQAGSYAAILPVLMNIAIAFILVMTPILLALGLLVPAWAPGVIITTLVSLFYLKMVGVVQILVAGILNSVESIFDAVHSSGKMHGLSSWGTGTYENFLDIIWGMSYMASFAITAFFLFAAGNTKQIIEKFTGMDSHTNKIATDIRETGWDITTKAAKISAGIATGGAMGGGLGMQAASAVGKAQAFSQLAGDQGLGTAIQSLGGSVVANKARRKHEALDSMNAALESDAKAMTREGISQEKRTIQSKEAVAKAKDAPLIALDDSLRDAQVRDNKGGRDKAANHAEAANISRATDKSLETAAKDHHVDGDAYKSISFSYRGTNGNLVKGKELSVTDQYNQSLEYELRKSMGYISKREDSMTDEQWKKIEARNSKIIADSSALAGNIAQGTYKEMDKANYYKDKDGKSHQGFKSYQAIQKNIEDNYLRQKGWKKDNLTDKQRKSLEDAMRHSNKVLSKFGKQTDNGGFDIKYKEELKDNRKGAKPKSRSNHMGEIPEDFWTKE